LAFIFTFIFISSSSISWFLSILFLFFDSFSFGGVAVLRSFNVLVGSGSAGPTLLLNFSFEGVAVLKNFSVLVGSDSAGPTLVIH
jgi:hypothetical protein